MTGYVIKSIDTLSYNNNKVYSLAAIAAEKYNKNVKADKVIN